MREPQGSLTASLFNRRTAGHKLGDRRPRACEYEIAPRGRPPAAEGHDGRHSHQRLRQFGLALTTILTLTLHKAAYPLLSM